MTETSLIALPPDAVLHRVNVARTTWETEVEQRLLTRFERRDATVRILSAPAGAGSYSAAFVNVNGTGPKTYKTMTRKVVVDYKSVWVVDDGDSWPNGCGDFIFVMSLNHAPNRATYGTKCVDCWGANCYSGCSIPRYYDVNYGDMAYGYNNLDLTKEGSRSLMFAATGVGSSVLAIAYGTLTVSYSA